MYLGIRVDELCCCSTVVIKKRRPVEGYMGSEPSIAHRDPRTSLVTLELHAHLAMGMWGRMG